MRKDAAVTLQARGNQQRLRLARPSRRAVLAATGLAAAGVPLAACRGVQSLGTPPPPPRDIRVLRTAITSEQALIAGCSAALAPLSASGQPGAAGLAAVRSVQAEHAAHLALLRSRLVEPPSYKPRTAPAPAPTPPAGSASALHALEQAEQAASDRLIGQLSGLPPALAQLLASIAASEATHVPFLRQAGRTAR
jgi:hypothetical protein